MVRVSDQVPPFFDGVFRDEDYESRAFLIPDPYILRAKPLHPDQGVRGGPTDILGFRNRCIPHRTDVIAIGDSQTYGNNARLDNNWPSCLSRALPDTASVVYGMAVGGWGPVQYLEIFPKALRFRPRLVVVAFYTGNDLLDAFLLAYANERWADLRPDPRLTEDDMPEVNYPPPKSEWWSVEFPDGTRTRFTPRLRYSCNQDHPAVRAGLEITGEVARRVGAAAEAAGVRVAFTVLPTKELAFAPRIEADGIVPPPDYQALVRAERDNISYLAGAFSKVPGAVYVDMVKVLQQQLLTETYLYPQSRDGHPLEAGYAVIAAALAERIHDLL
jgi:lysophospholipase L1-like esterase